MNNLKEIENELKDSEGYTKLLKSINFDCKKNMCTVDFKTCEKCNKTHNIKNKYQWILERLDHYTEKLNLSHSFLLNAWEEERTYWYMNYYQESNFPLWDINDKVFIFDTKEDYFKKFPSKKFICPACNEISTDPMECNANTSIDICNWKSYGFFKTLGKGVFIIIKKPQFYMLEIFKPIELEQ